MRAKETTEKKAVPVFPPGGGRSRSDEKASIVAAICWVRSSPSALPCPLRGSLSTEPARGRVLGGICCKVCLHGRKSICFPTYSEVEEEAMDFRAAISRKKLFCGVFEGTLLTPFRLASWKR